MREYKRVWENGNWKKVKITNNSQGEKSWRFSNKMPPIENNLPDTPKTIKEIEKGCGKLVYKNDDLKCGEWSGGDQHFCDECFFKLQTKKEDLEIIEEVFNGVGSHKHDIDIFDYLKEKIKQKLSGKQEEGE